MLLQILRESLRPELHQPHVPFGFCFAKHTKPAVRGQHYTLSVCKYCHQFAPSCLESGIEQLYRVAIVGQLKRLAPKSQLARVFGYCGIKDFYLTHIILRACHDANIAPWLLLANRLQLEASRENPTSQVIPLTRCAGWW